MCKRIFQAVIYFSMIILLGIQKVNQVINGNRFHIQQCIYIGAIVCNALGFSGADNFNYRLGLLFCIYICFTENYMRLTYVLYYFKISFYPPIHIITSQGEIHHLTQNLQTASSETNKILVILDYYKYRVYGLYCIIFMNEPATGCCGGILNSRRIRQFVN